MNHDLELTSVRERRSSDPECLWSHLNRWIDDKFGGDE